jgi:valyl-tRNA synthetase
MSKSLGNSPDPIAIIEAYGADALRFTMIALTPMGQDTNFDPKKTELGRNFANKIWNASRFLLMNLEGYEPSGEKADLDRTDRWILSRLDATTTAVTRAFEEDRYSDAAWTLYEYTWKELCDWYLEFAKGRFYSEDVPARRRAQDTALTVWRRILALLHPYFPFLTERIWGYLPERDGLLILSRWPEPGGWHDADAERNVELLKGAISAIRNMRAELNVPPSTEAPVVIRAEGEPAEVLATGEGYLRSLARVSELRVGATATKPPRSASAVAGGMEIYLPLEGLIDLDAEQERLGKKRGEIRKGLTGVEAKLANADFVARAPADVVAQESERRDRLRLELEAVERNLDALREEG